MNDEKVSEEIKKKDIIKHRLQRQLQKRKDRRDGRKKKIAKEFLLMKILKMR